MEMRDQFAVTCITGMHACAVLALGWLTVRGLRVMQRIEVFAPPLGARRLQFQRGLGDHFPTEHVPAPLHHTLAENDVLYVHVSKHCSLCKPILRSLPAIAGSHPETTFVVLVDAPWPELSESLSKRILYVESKAVVDTLGLSVLPVAMRVRQGIIVESAIVNSPEDVESVIGE